MKISCIAIDDEPIALKQITSYIQRTPFLDHIASCKSAFEAMSIIASNHIDLMFVDIQMPDLNGVDFVKACGKDQKIIFTTAYEQYAVDGFKVDAIDYILKPFGYDEFLKSAQKAFYYFKLLNRAKEENSTGNDYFFVRSDYKLRKVLLEDVQYVEGQREYVKIVLRNDSPVVTMMSMKSIEAKLPSSLFMRVHRSFIINLNHVEVFDCGCIILGKQRIPVSDQYKKVFMDYLDKKI